MASAATRINEASKSVSDELIQDPTLRSSITSRASFIDLGDNVDVNKNLNDRSDDDNALSDLREILDIAEAFIPHKEKANKRRSTGEAKKMGGLMTLAEESNEDDEDDDEWGGACDSNADCDKIVKGGYLELEQPNSSKFQKQYIVLRESRGLFFYGNKKDVSDNIFDAKGYLKASDVNHVQKSDDVPDRIEIYSTRGVYSLQAFTHSEAKEWYETLANFFSADTMRSTMLADEENVQFECNPLMNFPRRKNSVRRSSLDKSMMCVPSNILPEKKGFLKKKNKFFWEKRWFELRKNGTLFWYIADPNKHQSKIEPRGSLEIRNVISVQQQIKDSCFFDIGVKGRVYNLQADSEGLALEWTDALVTWVQHGGDQVDDEIVVDYDNLDEVKPLVNNVEMSLQGLFNRSDSNVSTGVGSDRDSFRDSYFNEKFSIHNRKRQTMGRPQHVNDRIKSKGRRTSIHVSLMNAENSCDHKPTINAEEMTGWVKKRGVTGREWRRRWVEIRKPGDIYWYSSDIDAAEGPKRAKGSIEITKILSVDMLPDDNHRFDINVRGRTYEFQAYGDEEAKYWYDVLLTWMESKNIEDLTTKSGSHIVRNPCIKGRPERSGYLLKRGVGSSRWQSRWFVLSSDGALYWYRSPKDAQETKMNAKGKLQLADVLHVELVSSKPTCFEIYVKGRTYELNASTDQEAREWILDIFQWVTELDCVSPTAVESSSSSKNDENLPKNIAYNSVVDVDHSNGLISDDLPEMSGYVKKKGEKKNSAWQVRWLELSRDGYLVYYKDSEGSKHGIGAAKGVISLADVLSVEMQQSGSGAFFDVDVQGRTFQVII